MIPVASTVVMVAALAWTLWCAVSALVGQAPTMYHRLGLAVLQGVAVVYAVALVVALITEGGRGGPGIAEILGYLATALLTLPVGAWLAQGERTRWGSAVFAIAGFTLAVLVLRMSQLWETTRV